MGWYLKIGNWKINLQTSDFGFALFLDKATEKGKLLDLPFEA
jgi:hypothetical protein